MKKLITLLLVLCAGIGQSKADYYVAGDPANTNQTSEGEWDPGCLENKMEDIGDGFFKLVVTGKSLTGGTSYTYKITEGNWDTSYGWGDNKDQNASFTPHITGTYDITYIFNSNSNDVWEASAILTDGPDIYLHSNKSWSDVSDYKFTKSNGVYTLDVDVSNETNTFYYRLHVDGWNDDCGTENGNFEISTGVFPEYNIDLSNGNYYGEHNFQLPLDTKPCAKLSLTLKIINRKIVVAMQCSEKVTTNANGYSTFVNSYPLAIAGATAYYATDNGNGSATAHAMTNPVAGTPMLIKGDASTSYYFEVSATGTSIDGANAFKAGSNSTVTSNGEGVYNYILNGETFYAANAQTVAANKAYLQLSAEASARPLIFEDEDIAGINAVRNVTDGDGRCYNMAGQQVAQPAKGLYIRNGRKFIVK